MGEVRQIEDIMQVGYDEMDIDEFMLMVERM